MSDNSSNNSGGINFLGLLTILFIGLKLTHNIDWSWWWVLAPMWIPFAVILGILLLVAILYGAAILTAMGYGKLTGKRLNVELPSFILRWKVRRALKRQQRRLK